MNKKIKLNLPFQKIHFQYKESSPKELTIEEMIILNLIYKNKYEYNKNLFSLIKENIGINNNFNNYLIEKIWNLFQKKYINLKNSDNTLEKNKIESEYMIGNIEIHKTLFNNFEKNNPIGFEIEKSEKELFYYKSLIDNCIDESFTKENKKLNIEKFKGNLLIDLSQKTKNNEQLINQFSEIIEQEFILKNDKNKQLIELNILNEKEIIFLIKEMEFDFNLKNNEILLFSNNKQSNKIIEKIEEEKDIYLYLLPIFLESIFNDNYDFKIENYSKYEDYKENPNLEQIIHFIKNIQKIKEMEKLTKFFINESIVFFEEKWFFIRKKIINFKTKNLEIKSNIPIIYLEEIKEFASNYYSYFIDKFSFKNNFDELQNYLNFIIKIEDNTLMNEIIKKINIDISKLNFPNFLKYKEIIKKEKLEKYFNFENILNENYFIDFDFNEILNNEINDLTKKIIKFNVENKKIKEIIQSKLELIENISKSFFEEMIKIYNLDPNKNIQILLKTNFFKKYNSLVFKTKKIIEKLNKKNINLREIKVDIDILEIEINKEMLGYKIDLFNELKEKLKIIESQNIISMKKNYIANINLWWPKIELFLKNKNKLKENNQNYTEVIKNSSFLNYENKNLLIKFKKERNNINHYSGVIFLKNISYKKMKEKYDDLEKMISNIKKIIKEGE